jgi:hypothetical protein
MESAKEHIWQTEPFLIDTIISLCKSYGVTAIWEIGTFQGHSSKAFSEAGFKVVTSDIESHVLRKDKTVRYIIGQSSEINFEVAKLLEGETVAVFIDGDHSYEGCAKDFKALESVGLSNFVFFHDAQNAGCMGVNQFIREQHRNPHYESLIIPTVDGTGLGIVRRR